MLLFYLIQHAQYFRFHFHYIHLLHCYSSCLVIYLVLHHLQCNFCPCLHHSFFQRYPILPCLLKKKFVLSQICFLWFCQVSNLFDPMLELLILKRSREHVSFSRKEKESGTLYVKTNTSFKLDRSKSVAPVLNKCINLQKKTTTMHQFKVYKVIQHRSLLMYF